MRSGAHAIKLEGVDGHEDVIRQIVGSGVPVMGHVGLTPQSVNEFGGFRVQGREAEDAEKIARQAHALEELGCFSLVLECIPAPLAARITRRTDDSDYRHRRRSVHRTDRCSCCQDLWGVAGDHSPRIRPRYIDGETMLT
jgi:3-methyl-2-oxobutanoate hydroxymethyltransferase